jgi:hypothetical protein
MFGWFNEARTCASRRKRTSRSESTAKASGKIFSATKGQGRTRASYPDSRRTFSRGRLAVERAPMSVAPHFAKSDPEVQLT